MKTVLIIVLIVMGGLFLAASLPSSSSAPPPVQTMPSTAIDHFSAIWSLDIKDFRWSAQYGTMMVSLVFDNRGDYDVKDIKLVCQHSAPSGTKIDSNNRTIYEIVPARSKKAIKDFSMGFIHNQAQRTNCSVQDLVVGAYRAPSAAKPKKDTSGAAPATTTAR